MINMIVGVKVRVAEDSDLDAVRDVISDAVEVGMTSIVHAESDDANRTRTLGKIAEIEVGGAKLCY